MSVLRTSITCTANLLPTFRGFAASHKLRLIEKTSQIPFKQDSATDAY